MTIDVNTVLILNAAVTWALVGLIWTIQLVHYPLFEGVGAAGFVSWHRRHATRITFLVGVGMPIEALTAGALVIAPPAGVSLTLLAVGLGLVVLVWLATALLSMPCHRRLEAGFDRSSIRRLVVTNWVRTTAWTARGVIVAAALAQRLAA